MQSNYAILKSIDNPLSNPSSSGQFFAIKIDYFIQIVLSINGILHFILIYESNNTD